jgi:hypothetical protein
MQFDRWFQAHMHGVLWVIEVLWVAGFLAIFVFYFIIKRRLRKKKMEAAAKQERTD